ncbi:23S rRNA pseudouridine(2605) synthase RluB [Salinibius halmophilus]|uniref:23S rRNA pseudouridine(2605) synthase RluB n=1 Tax=Salinibius halmophilus TaxID=1853216 RepID=UPI000E66A8E6|nr:pseudouridine synthase [Salinibius halmophilus]
MTQNKDRLQKYLANQGVASRREVERMITDGRIQVNDEPVELGMRVDGTEKITIDGRPLKRQGVNARRVLMYNKPEGEVCSQNDPEGRPTVFDRLPKVKGQRWIMVGRLDLNTSGLLLFTTDGELANRLMHPSYNVDREYAIRVLGAVTDETMTQLKDGVMLEDGKARFTDLQRYKESEGINQWFHAVLMEGRNREVRRMWEAVGHKVSRLKRVRYGTQMLDSVKVGTWRELEQAEVNRLSNLVGLDVVSNKVDVKTDKETKRKQAAQQHRAKPVRRK